MSGSVVPRGKFLFSAVGAQIKSLLRASSPSNTVRVVSPFGCRRTGRVRRVREKQNEQSLSCLPACLPSDSETFSEPPRRNWTLFPPRLLVSHSSPCDFLLCYSFILSSCLKFPVVSPPSLCRVCASGSPPPPPVFCEPKAACVCLLPAQRRAAVHLSSHVLLIAFFLKRLWRGGARFPLA